MRNMIYSHKNSGSLEIVTGWSDQGLREFDQEVVRPAQRDLPKNHPCAVLNADLLRCSLGCPPEMKLGGRTATCNTERQALMRCLVKNKRWVEPQGPGTAWYRFW